MSASVTPGASWAHGDLIGWRPSARWITAGLVLLSLALGIAGEGSKLADLPKPPIDYAVDIVTGAAFALVGLWLRLRTDHTRLGAVVMLAGCAWFAEDLQTSTNHVLNSLPVTAASGPALVYLVLSFPTGRLARAADRVLFLAAAGLALIDSSLNFYRGGCRCATALAIWISHGFDAAHQRILGGLGAAIALAVAAEAARRWRATDPAARAFAAPFYGAAILFAVITATGNLQGLLGSARATPASLQPVLSVTLPALPIAVAFAVVNMRSAVLVRSLQVASERAATADQKRRELERDLHDGAQQRLVALGLALRVAQRRLQVSGPAAIEPALEGAVRELETALAELRALVRGSRPAMLADNGLGPALRDLAARTQIPVELDVPSSRLPPEIETTAFFLACEATVNAVKHARASHVSIAVRRAPGWVTIEVVDDGVGGADSSRGSGLDGLRERLEARGGSLAVHSPVGGGTRIVGELPSVS